MVTYLVSYNLLKSLTQINMNIGCGRRENDGDIFLVLEMMECSIDTVLWRDVADRAPENQKRYVRMLRDWNVRLLLISHIAAGMEALKPLAGTENPVDILTKALPETALKKWPVGLLPYSLNGGKTPVALWDWNGMTSCRGGRVVRGHAVSARTLTRARRRRPPTLSRPYSLRDKAL